ncbi:MAG: tRNA (pseudouridine(54)-N(1))-methyltransferase TrmY [Nanoarchaeota archaeon]
MRQFVYFSSTARTSGNFDASNLMDAGRMDIAIHVIINAFFLSHNLRDDVKLHLIFYGMPDPPKHIEMQVKPETNLSKKDVANLIRKILYKYKEGKKTEALPGCFVEKKSFLGLIEELRKEGNKIFILDKKGKDIRKSKLSEKSVFVIGDHNGFPKKELRRLKDMSTLISVGPKTYFASHVVTILNNEMDLRDF